MNAVTTRRRKSKQDLNTLMTRYAPLVKRIAHHLGGRLPASIQSSDLIQAGMIGLLDAARNYNALQGASFQTYAGIRIRGAMLDEVRRSDWVPRSVHRRVRELARAVVQIENAKGRHARGREIAEVLGVSLDEYHEILRDISGCRILSFDEVPPDDGASVEDVSKATSDPSYALQADQIRRTVTREIARLPEREKLVLALYYHEELNLKEIGEVLNVSESRVCQIHGQALIRLKARLFGKIESEEFDPADLAIA